MIHHDGRRGEGGIGKISTHRTTHRICVAQRLSPRGGRNRTRTSLRLMLAFREASTSMAEETTQKQLVAPQQGDRLHPPTSHIATLHMLKSTRCSKASTPTHTRQTCFGPSPEMRASNNKQCVGRAVEEYQAGTSKLQPGACSWRSCRLRASRAERCAHPEDEMLASTCKWNRYGIIVTECIWCCACDSF
jgi:hypothetical protein